ncbi:thioesterase [Massilia sp. UMI-21]|nr:thioesterase [Massilia sp. UMI-21]
MKSTPWMVRQTCARPLARLFCFSYAGGSAANYRAWHGELAPAIEVCAMQLPGRGARFSETPMSSMVEIVQAAAAEIARQDDGKPFYFLGHSLGGLLAFEVARHCQAHALPMPEHLFVAGCAAPQMRGPSNNLHTLSDRDFLAALRDYGGTAPEVLASQELMQLLLPMMRADFGLAEEYDYRTAPLLEIPITVLAGESDDLVSPAQAKAWQLETDQAFGVEWFNGNHFFVDVHRRPIQQLVRNRALAVVRA